ncbi:beta family protein [Blastococcus saxobsidens]|uniref:T4 beta protein n=1 Tax=Blastococcus saxobsidens (strain DD2) TaxID=1146883 RepID=H6RQ87_BLASD|nr:beta family protein [Blastococcus saxobsidens]CCG04054.1 conserved protein of unknown function; putative phage-related protein [Blastococcus saxobsidens DD2]
MATRYVPILKSRQGELNALRDASPQTRQSMVPLVEVVPPSEDPSPGEAIDKACIDAATKLADRYSGQPLMLDAGLFDLTVKHRSQTAVGLLAEWAASTGLDAWPVIRLDDPESAQIDAGRAHERDGRGVTIRLDGEDLDEDAEDVDNALAGVLSNTGTTRADTDLLLDVGAIDGDIAVRGGASLVRSLLRGLEDVDQWRSVTVAAGAFPIDLSQFSPRVIGERPRFDAQLFDAVRSKRLPRDIDFGDFAIAHPALSTGPAFLPPPQLRYTTAEHWLVLKGRRNDPEGNAQFHWICETIAKHPDFVGARLGRADEVIASGSLGKPGNGTTWRTIGTTHHLDYVSLRLTTVGEP